jgi:YebC/PmpR family DNA-binding regulatory protein
MAGHSKWANTKHRKGRQDAKRGKLFSKLSRQITVAAKLGDPNPENNAGLALAVQKAKDASMPKDNIERAIQKAIGGGDGENYEAITYEGYGPAGVAVIVEALTDNRNRTASEVRHAFGKFGGSLGETGCVAWVFERQGHVVLAEGTDEEAAMLAAIEAGADDVDVDGSIITVRCQPTELASVRGALEGAGFGIEHSELVLEPKNTVELDEKHAATTLRLVEALEDLDDVQEVSANFDIPDSVLESVAGA